MNETTVQETIQYPEWQAKIRMAQAKRAAEYAEKQAKQEADLQLRHLENINRMREVLAGYGLNLPKSTTGEWVLDNYTFKVNPNHWNSDLTIIKSVPGADAILFESPDSELWDTDYRVQRQYLLEWRWINDAAIADAIDTLDADIRQQIETNQRVLSRLAERQSQTKDESEPQPEPTLESRLIAIFREIAREEIAIAQAAQMDIY